jgi:hypothetical protein
MKPTEFTTEDTIIGDRIHISGHIVLTMPLRKGVLPGRSHTASCTLCRDRLVKAGQRPDSTAGALGFFQNENHRDMVVNGHVENHAAVGDMVHVVNLPPRLTPTIEEEVNNG